MEILSQVQTTESLPFERLIPALEQMFSEGCEVPLRHNHVIKNIEGRQDGTLLLMPAWQTGKRLGVKTVSIFPDNRLVGLPGLHSVFILYDATTGKPLAILDGDAITSRRTAAASALAARWLSRPESSKLLIVGAGRVASLLAQAYRAVRPINTVHVWNVRPQGAQDLVQSLRAAGFDAHHAADLEQATRQADIVTCATLATEPLILGHWLQPGTHLDLIGSFTPAMRESDAECFRAGTIFVDTDEAPMKSGDIIEAAKAGAYTAGRLAATLQDLCRGRHPGRSSATEITVYKAVGTALADLAAASLAFDTHNETQT